MAGVAAVMAGDQRIRIQLSESRDAGSMEAAGFYHARVGRNHFPDEKLCDFASLAEHAFVERGGIGLVKLCYVDVRADTDPTALFNLYRQRMAELAVRCPRLRLVHVTMPLTTAPRSWRYWRTRLLGRATDEDLNLIRNRYNSLLRAAYDGREPVFDLARIESTRPDGSRASFVRNGETVCTPSESYTRDGGHLDADASRMVAEQLLILLAGLTS